MVRRRPAPPSLLEVAERVEVRLRSVLAAETSRWTDLDPDASDLLEPLADLVLAGGKRLRPAFCFWGFVGAGGDPGDQLVVDVGAAFEFLQAFALVHDDVMDGSPVRRGEVAAHIAAGRRHTAERWRGEARRFGEAVAILVGDLSHVYADRLVAGAPPSARRVWDELRIELNVGQYLDVVATAQASTDRGRARLIARYKSGKYTIERPLQMGAALAGRYEDLAEPLSAYGDPLGEAFQLRDDLLGAFGDQAVTGKPVGDDLREGKPTPLLAAAAERASGATAGLLTRVGDPDLTEDDVAAIQQVFVDCGAVAEVESVIESLATTAVEAIGSADLTPAARDALVDLAHYVAWRES